MGGRWYSLDPETPVWAFSMSVWGNERSCGAQTFLNDNSFVRIGATPNASVGTRNGDPPHPKTTLYAGDWAAMRLVNDQGDDNSENTVDCTTQPAMVGTLGPRSMRTTRLVRVRSSAIKSPWRGPPPGCLLLQISNCRCGWRKQTMKWKGDL